MFFVCLLLLFFFCCFFFFFFLFVLFLFCLFLFCGVWVAGGGGGTGEKKYLDTPIIWGYGRHQMNITAYSADDKLKTVFFFPQKKRSDIPCKLFQLETICMNYQILFPGKMRKKYFKMSSTEPFTQSAKRR